MIVCCFTGKEGPRRREALIHSPRRFHLGIDANEKTTVLEQGTDYTGQSLVASWSRTVKAAD